MAKKKVKKAKIKKAINRKPSLESRIAANKKEIEKIQRKLERNSEKLLREVFREIFKRFPKVQSISWNQYTPAWNDGDECVFGCYFESVKINGEEGGESVWELSQILDDLSGNVEKKRSEIQKELGDASKKDWELNNLRKRLANLDRDPEEVEEKYKTRKTITDLLESIHEPAFKSMFGEGEVTVCRDGSTSVEECDYD